MSVRNLMDLSVLKNSRGLALVFFGFMTVYLSAVQVDADSTVRYWLIGFGFLVASAGIGATFLELRKDHAKSESLDLASEEPELGHAVRQLSRNYDVLRRQATQGFILAGTVMILGVCVVLGGSVGNLFGLTEQSSNLTTVAGLVIEVVSGIGLYLFRQTFQRLNITSDRLHDAWKLQMAFNMAESLPEEHKAPCVSIVAASGRRPGRQAEGPLARRLLAAEVVA